MNLFITDGDTLSPAENTLLIYPFNEIWSRDTSNHKVEAIREFKFIEFLCSYKKSNPFAGFDSAIKEKKVTESIAYDKPDWEPDELVREGVRKYTEFRDEASPTLKLYLAALNAADQMRDYYNTLDMKKSTKTGMLVNKPADVARGLKETGSILTSLAALKTKVEQELIDDGRARANRQVNYFER